MPAMTWTRAASTFLRAFRRCREVAEVLVVAGRVEHARSRRGPLPLVTALRARGLRARRRDDADRDHLRRVIGVVDRCFPGGGNCYRRALVEMALDAGAAT